jgi:hypothetical protein
VKKSPKMSPKKMPPKYGTIILSGVTWWTCEKIAQNFTPKIVAQKRHHSDQLVKKSPKMSPQHLFPKIRASSVIFKKLHSEDNRPISIWSLWYPVLIGTALTSNFVLKFQVHQQCKNNRYFLSIVMTPNEL